MRYDVFLRTRVENDEYEWMNLPDYLPNKIHKTTFKTVIELCDNKAFDDLSWDEWNQNFFYLRGNDYCVLSRISRTDYKGDDGQRIISFEGVTLPPEKEVKLFRNLPSIISQLFPPEKSFRKTFEELEGMYDSFDANMLINPFDGYKIPEGVSKTLSNSAAFKTLLRFCAFSEKPKSFVFGKNARDFSRLVDNDTLGIDYVFDLDSPDEIDVDESLFNANYQPVKCTHTPPVPTGIDKVAISMLIEETGENTYRYRWEVKPWDNTAKDPKRVRYATKFYEVEEKFELAKLELQKESIKNFLLNNGWERQRNGLRFEKELYQREGV